MDADKETIAWVVGVLSGVAGILEYSRRVIRTKAENEARHLANEKEIVRLLNEVNRVENTLMDVLKHPDDSGFGIGPVLEKLEDLQDRIEHLERAVRDAP